MELASPSLTPAPENGGFPEPPPARAVRLFHVRHLACGETTMIRIPRELPARAVRVVICASCGEEFVAGGVSEMDIPSPSQANGHSRPKAAAALNGSPLNGSSALAEPRPTPFGARRAIRLSVRPRMPRLRRSGGATVLPAYASFPIALAAVAGGLILIQSWGASTPPSERAAAPAAPAAPAPATAAADATATQATPSSEAQLIRGTNFTLALPPGWKATTPQGGATFTAAASDGSADATLWIRNDPKLDFPTFEAGSLAQLRTLAGSAHVAARVSAATPEATIVRLAADAPAGKPAYAVTLRVSGPYRYYLSTTLEPNASPAAAKGVELLSNSLTPVLPGSGQ